MGALADVGVWTLGHTHVGDGDEGAGRAKAPCCPLGLLKQAVHGLDQSL